MHNTASQAVLLRKDQRTVLSITNNYRGPAEDFAMVVPVPVVLKKEQVRTLPADVFERIDRMSAPRLVEYWESDPCPPPPGSVTYQKSIVIDLEDDTVEGDLVRPDGASGVRVEARFAVGEYDVLILSAKESLGLQNWLIAHNYKLPPNAAVALAPYIRDGMKFFVAKVDIKKVRRDAQGAVVLSPLRFSYESPDLRLPVRPGLLNSQGQQDLLIYIIHPDRRFEVANYPNLLIPTNLEVTNAAAGNFGAFYAALFDATLRQGSRRGVVTEYAWSHRISESDANWDCDPCPKGPALTVSDVFTLGADELYPRVSGDVSLKFVLTRLHTRYEPSALSADLIFRAVPGLSGGLANSAGQSVQIDKTDEEGDWGSHFQGRYIIRHLFEGPIACAKPQYGKWDGGPPANGRAGRRSQTATDLANQTRGTLQLSTLVRSPVPALQLKGIPRPLRRGEAASAALPP